MASRRPAGLPVLLRKGLFRPRCGSRGPELTVAPLTGPLLLVSQAAYLHGSVPARARLVRAGRKAKRGSLDLRHSSDWDFPSSDVFSGLEIDPGTLVRKLDLDSRSIISSRTGWQYPSLQTGEVEQPSGCWQMLFLAQQLGSVPPPGEVQIVLCGSLFGIHWEAGISSCLCCNTSVKAGLMGRPSSGKES
ncbi:ribosome biogenesis protein SLX9 homolog isoform 2-T2 [Morphnus guianensis]